MGQEIGNSSEKLRIVITDDNKCSIYMDGKQVERVKSVDFHFAANEVPSIKIDHLIF